MLEPDNARCLNNLGWVLQQSGRAQEALEPLRKAVAADPALEMAAINLALAFEQVGDTDASRAQWEAAVQDFPESSDARFGLANSHYAADQQPEALAEYLRALALQETNPEAHNNVGLIYLEQGNLTEAVAHFRLALQQKPEFASAANNLGVVLERQGEPDKAVEKYRKAIELDPDCESAQQNLQRLAPPAETAVG